jgi:post-segregation antitoxin (ccd killing protein)
MKVNPMPVRPEEPRQLSAKDSQDARADAAARTERWYQENREGVDSWNDYVAKHGTPLGRFRTF